MVSQPVGAEAPNPAAHPGPRRAVLPAAIRDALVAHARAEYPNEMCGIVSGSADAAAGGMARAWHPTRNAYASPHRYSVHPADLLAVFEAIDDADQQVWGIAHSHVRTPARPSPTDVGLAANWPAALYLLVSLADSHADAVTGEPSVRAWRIVDGELFEVMLDIAP